MKKHEVRAWIEDVGIIPAVRMRSAEDALFAVEAISQGGIPIAEITLTVPGAIRVISRLRTENQSFFGTTSELRPESTWNWPSRTDASRL